MESNIFEYVRNVIESRFIVLYPDLSGISRLPQMPFFDDHACRCGEHGIVMAGWLHGDRPPLQRGQSMINRLSMA